jgi:glycosyltransferase involved in cell wall biosynthesis
MVSALIESKMVATGIEAVSHLPGVHLAVAGDGPLRDQLRAQAESALPGRYHNFTVTADRMPDLYRSASAFLHLSRDESFGNVFVEAMASGLRTVAWDLPRTRWITAETALLVPDGDKCGLVDGIAEVLAGSFPSGGIVAQAKNFAWSTIAAQYSRFLAEVTGCKEKLEETIDQESGAESPSLI